MWFLKKKQSKRIILAIYLLLVFVLFIDYWFISEKPFFAPVYALLFSHFGHIEDLPLGKSWVTRFTYKINSEYGAGFIYRQGSIFLPFPKTAKEQTIELEVRSLFICLGFQTRMGVFIDKKLVLLANIKNEWQTFHFQLPKEKVFPARYMKLKFDMVQTGNVPGYSDEKILCFFPGNDAPFVLKTGKWKLSKEGESLFGNLIRQEGDVLNIGDSQYRLDLPLIVALTDWNSSFRGSAINESPLVACRSVRLTDGIIQKEPFE